jgi:hypothetical protein
MQVDSALAFSFDMTGVDRQAVLTEAARQFDLQHAHLGAGGSIAGTPAGALARALLEDVAEFGKAPEVYRIGDEELRAVAGSVSPLFKQQSETSIFYWIHIPIFLRPQRSWAFTRLEVLIEFNRDAADPYSRPRAYQILPDRKFQSLLEVSDSLEIVLDENLQFKAQTGSLGMQAGSAGAMLDGSAGVTLGGGVAFKAGKFEYRLKRAKIDHTATGLEKVFWRLDGAEFFQDNQPSLVVIAQLPRETHEMKVDALLQAYRRFGWFSADVQDAVEQLAQSLRTFFRAGAPLQDAAVWDLTTRL